MAATCLCALARALIVLYDLMFWRRFLRTPAQDRRSIQVAVAILFPIAMALIVYVEVEWLVQLGVQF
jgi:hypothetical protein